MRLAELMTRSVKTIRAAEPAREARDRMRLHGFHHLVVIDGKKVIGVISERDVRSANSRESLVADVMTGDVAVAAPHTTVRQAANLLRGRSIGCLPIVEDGHLVGIVTVTDLLELLGKGAARPEAPEGRWKPIRRSERHPRNPH